MPFRRNKLAVAVILGTGFSLVLTLLSVFGAFRLLQLQLANFLYHDREPSPQIVLVTVDDQTLDSQMGFGNFLQVNRKHFAKVLDNINQYQPKVVGLDFFFRKEQKEAFDLSAYTASNLALATALDAIQNPVIMFPDLQENNLNEGIMSGELLLLDVLRNIPHLTIAIPYMVRDQDDTSRTVFPRYYHSIEEKYYDTFSFAIAKKALGFAENDVLPVPLDESGQMIINYATAPQQGTFGYNSISFADVYFERYAALGIDPEEFFRDKIVLIGPTALFFNDSYLTPLSKINRMPGVIIHANAVQTILEGKFLRPLSVVEKALLILMLVFSSVFVCMYTKIRWSLLWVIVTTGIYAVLTPVFFEWGIIVDLLYAPLAPLTSFMGVYVYRYLTEFREKSALKSAFGKYVNPTIAEKIAAETPESLKLGGAKRDITVLFTDIAHFTSISEQLTPESLVALLNEYLEAMSQVIMAEGGTVDKFEGDAIMAFFGAPLDQPDHALRACRTALAMQRRLTELHAKWEQENAASLRSAVGGEPKPLFNFRCGLSSGEAIIGNIGSSERLEYTAMGDIVNLGSRLEGANKKYSTSTMMSEDTYRRVADSVFARELDILRVVGKKQPVKVFELLGMKDDVSKEGDVLLGLYGQGIALYHARKFAEALAKFDEILVQYPDDGPSKLYRQRCEVLRDFPPPADWDGVFEMKSK